MSVEELEKAIVKQSSEERGRLLKLLRKMDADEWDRQIEQDAKGGKLDKLGREALKDVTARRFRKV